MTDLVETQFGYHIIKLTEKQAATTSRSTTSCARQIQQYLENQQRQTATQAFVSALRAKGKSRDPHVRPPDAP
jgi:peptidyl-prolyl cis-trans isomerase C